MQILIIGNGKVNSCFKPSEYNQIIMFNRLNNKCLIPFMTQHWIRSYKENSYWGKELITTHNAPVMIVSAFPSCKKEGLSMSKEYSRKVDVCDYRGFESWYETNKGKNSPSTGMICIKHFLDKGYNITLDGFSFQGVKLHNWKFEKQFVKNSKVIIL